MFFTITLIMTVVIVIPAFIVAAGYVVGFGACDRPDTTATSTICTPLGRLLFAAALVAVGVPLARTWVKFLARNLVFEHDEVETRVASERPAQLRIPANASKNLPGWQQLVSGTICDQTARTILFAGSPLTFWSVHGFQRGWLKPGDRTIIVYQRTPLRGLNLALAYWNSRLSSVSGVAAGTQTVSVLVGVTCIFLFAWFRPIFADFWIVLCAALSAMNSVYLALMLRAKTALRNFIDSEIPQ